MLIKKIWKKVENFQLETNKEVYGFITRLANENSWTKDFTKQAILEYKKFMYLAATSNQMVSPSYIVDLVWHQHLIFTKSYYLFCELLGKQIQHIPSTHNREDFQKFRDAEQRTFNLYEEVFGTKPPRSIWKNKTMLDGLELKPAKFKLADFIKIGLQFFGVLTIFISFFIDSVYRNIHNPNFIIGAFVITGLTFIIIDTYNHYAIYRLIEKFRKTEFFKNFYPSELIFLKTNKIAKVIDAAVYSVIERGAITVKSDKKLKEKTIFNNRKYSDSNKEGFQIVQTLINLNKEKRYYPMLNKELQQHAIYKNIKKSIESLAEKLDNSVEFAKIFYPSFILVITLIIFSVVRVFTGIMRGRPIIYISIFTILLIAGGVFYLLRLKKSLKSAIITKRLTIEDRSHSKVKWNYLLSGAAIFDSQFSRMSEHSNSSKSGTDSSCSSCSTCSSCSSCSSCGGCGGCGD